MRISGNESEAYSYHPWIMALCAWQGIKMPYKIWSSNEKIFIAFCIQNMHMYAYNCYAICSPYIVAGYTSD